MMIEEALKVKSRTRQEQPKHSSLLPSPNAPQNIAHVAFGAMRGDREPSPASARPHVLLLCSPCMGHLIPFAELARRLVADHGLGATVLFAAATDSPSEQYAELAASVPDGVDLVALSAPPALPSTATVRERAVHAAAFSIPRVRDIIKLLTSTAPLAALVVDMISVTAREVATELGVPCYMFCTSPWILMSMLLHLPELDAGLVGEYRDATEPIRLPGCVPIHAHELPDLMLVRRSGDAHAWFLSMAKDAARVDGILVNTFRALEPGVGDSTDGVKLPVHAVGPLVWTRPLGVNRDHSRVIRWLDKQPDASVVYVSFGSGGTLTWRQTTELALALEMAQRRFVWVVKRPDEETASGAFFGTRQGEDDDEALDFLPRGFVERTSGMGLVLPSWAPQTAILAHASVGCFVTHCGWNSSLESILNGVPMVAWPLYAEQRMNAAMLEVQAGVAVRVHADPDGFFSKEEIAGVIRGVMDEEEGASMRKRVGEFRGKAEQALTKDGTSAHALAHVADTWRSSSSGEK